MNAWSVYIIRCSDDSLYTGISTDVERRLEEHRAGRTGAKYFRSRSPEQLVFVERDHDRSSASIREAEIKKMSRAEKLSLISCSEITS